MFGENLQINKNSNCIVKNVATDLICTIMCLLCVWRIKFCKKILQICRLLTRKSLCHTQVQLRFIYICFPNITLDTDVIFKFNNLIRLFLSFLVSLILITDVIVFGGDIILTCTANGISTIDSEVTRQWSMGTDDELLCYNGRINNPKKYEETLTSKNQYSLKILKVTEEDVNITYQCRYGFDAASTFIDINKYNHVSKYQIWYKI